MGPALIGKAVIVGGGAICDYEAVASRIEPGDFILCADSGFDHCARLGVTPSLLVGDFDSIRSTPPKEIPRLPFPAEKDETDTALAIRIARERGFAHLLLTGMLGGRLDHTLANLQSLAQLSEDGVQALMTDGCTDAIPLTNGSLTLLPRAECYFSILCYSERCVGVTILGAQYGLDDYTLRFDVPRAISNEFLAGPVTVRVREGTLLILVVPKD